MLKLATTTVSFTTNWRILFAITLAVGSDDIRDVDLTKIHNLSGPIAVEGAEPGDCLVVDILDGEAFSAIWITQSEQVCQ